MLALCAWVNELAHISQRVYVLLNSSYYHQHKVPTSEIDEQKASYELLAALNSIRQSAVPEQKSRGGGEFPNALVSILLCKNAKRHRADSSGGCMVFVSLLLFSERNLSATAKILLNI